MPIALVACGADSARAQRYEGKPALLGVVSQLIIAVVVSETQKFCIPGGEPFLGTVASRRGFKPESSLITAVIQSRRRKRLLVSVQV